jgi:hypothetical protein
VEAPIAVKNLMSVDDGARAIRIYSAKLAKGSKIQEENQRASKAGKH